jgi:membrane fusion protein (multidrug efflux system)
MAGERSARLMAWWGIPAVLLLLGGPVWGGNMPAPAPIPATPVPSAGAGSVRALLVPVQRATLSSELDAVVVQLPYREGESFTKGASLVVFDCGWHRAQMGARQAELEAARTKLASDMELAQRGSIGRLEVSLSQSQEKKSQSETEMSRILVNRCTIKAPYNGTVVVRHIQEHERAGVGSKLLEIVDNRTLEAEIVLPSSWLTWLKPGHPVTLAVDETRTSHPLKVDRIVPSVDPVSQSSRIMATFDRTPPGLAAGMSGSASLATSEAKPE